MNDPKTGFASFPFRDVSGKLRKADFSKLPGQQSQLTMAPALRRDDIIRVGKGMNAISSGVLILLFPDSEGQTCTVFIRRPVYDGVHSGQIALPGGRREKQDPDLQYTALREANEEVGVNSSAVELVGKLSDLYIPPSNYIVSPFVGMLHSEPKFKPDPIEVEQIIRVRMIEFFRTENIREVSMRLSAGDCLPTPCFDVNGQIIWGATAMIMAEFLAFIKPLLAGLTNPGQQTDPE